MAETPLRVLCLDIEGGHGGSSRSLLESIRHMDRARLAIEVWCRRDGAARARYADLGVACRITPTMPKVSALPRLSRNLYVHGFLLRDLWRARGFLADLTVATDSRFDLVHCNHEALHPVARRLRRRSAIPLTMHIRTNLHDSLFARRQVRAIAGAVDHLVFITENERESFARLGGRPRAGSVIHNIATPPPPATTPHPDIPQDARFRVACLSNYSWGRGLDRLVDVAEALAAAGRRDVVFVVAGDMHLTRSLPGALGRTARQGGTLADYATARGVGELFLFLGHVAEPERVLVACDALAKPTREANPWGRDVIEALAAGRPVFSVGRYDRFVADGVTGILQPEFDAAALARRIAALADDRVAAAALGAAGQARVAALCDGPARAAELLALWRAVAGGRA